MHKSMRSVLFALLLLIVLLSGSLTLVSAQAPKPSIEVAPTWKASQMLTSLNSDGNPAFPSDDNDGLYEPGGDDDDARYVELAIQVTTTVEFWTMQLTCTVTPTLLTSYTWDDTNNTDDWQDDTAQVLYTGTWGGQDIDFTLITEPFDLVKGTHTVTASRMGSIPGIGNNGNTNTYELFIFRYLVKPQASATFKGAATASCAATFLDRNGKPAAPVKVLAPPPLPIIAGYSITGTALYQGMTNHTGIGVACNPPSGPAVSTRTASTGAFTLNGLREQGGYWCQFFGNNAIAEPLASPPVQDPDPFLAAFANFELWGQSYNLLPITLRAGNVERTVSDTWIDFVNDIVAVTSHWNQTAATAWSEGDANNDKKIDKVDLALVSGNTDVGELVNADHLLIGGQRGPGSIYPDSRIWLGDSRIGDGFIRASQLIPGTNRDFWPALSPDGSRIAFIRALGPANNVQYALFVMPSNGKGAAVQLTPKTGWDYDAFAPAWSPDGTRIAFNCAWASPNSWWGEWRDNTSSICVIDANGRNLRMLPGSAKINPPAWWDNNQLIFAGTSFNGWCPDSLCGIWLPDSAVFEFEDTLTTHIDNAGVEDKPFVVYGRLYYRYDDDGLPGGTTTLRMATLNYDGDADLIEPFQAAPPAGGCCATEYHVQVGALTAVDAFAVSNDAVIMSEYFWDGLNYNSGYNFSYHWFDGDTFYNLGGAPAWDGPFYFYIDNLWGNPWWDGVNETDLHALRNSIHWVP